MNQMTKSTLLTQAYLKSILHYDPETGVFTWKEFRCSVAVEGQRAGSLKPNGYRELYVAGKAVGEHKLAFLYMTGSIPDMIDHINRDRSDNRWINLRPATISQNMANACYAKGISGCKGVIQGGKKKWRARVMVNGKHYYMGPYFTLEAAAAARRVLAVKFFGEFARHD